jgi:hypothetical protein
MPIVSFHLLFLDPLHLGRSSYENGFWHPDSNNEDDRLDIDLLENFDIQLLHILPLLMIYLSSSRESIHFMMSNNDLVLLPSLR